MRLLQRHQAILTARRRDACGRNVPLSSHPWCQAPGVDNRRAPAELDSEPKYHEPPWPHPRIAAPGRPDAYDPWPPYPVLLPTLRDPRLHLAAVIVSLQVLGQVAFQFRLSIAQILVSLSPAPRSRSRSRSGASVIMWPASALLTGNGVAFILRVPGHRARRLVEHERLVDLRRHGRRLAALEVPDPLRGRTSSTPRTSGSSSASCCSAPARAEPLDFWWGPMSRGSSLALAIIVAGGLRDPPRLELLAHRGRLLARLRRRHRRARGDRARDDGALAPRPDLGGTSGGCSCSRPRSSSSCSS